MVAVQMAVSGGSLWSQGNGEARVSDHDSCWIIITRRYHCRAKRKTTLRASY